MGVKLIAFDLDGTLLDDRKQIPEENMRALRAAAEAGVILVPATGRLFKGISPQIRELPGTRYFLVVNGSLVYDKLEERFVAQTPMPLELCLKMIDYAETLPVLYDCYQDNEGLISRNMYDKMDEFILNEATLRATLAQRTPVDDLRQELIARGKPVHKFQMHFKDMELKARELETLERRFPGTVATTSMPQNIELNVSEATKGNALGCLCELLGIDISESMAFGDGSNDLSMIQAAGIGVAMGNACQELKAAADWIAPGNNEAGMAAGIYKFLDL